MKHIICLLSLFTSAPILAQHNLFEGGIVNAASLAKVTLPNSSIAQGSVFSAFGSNLGPAQSPSLAFPLQTTLGGVSLTVLAGGQSYNAIPLFVSPGQINAVLPSAVPAGSATLTVNYNGASNAASFQIVAHSFGIFTMAQSGAGPGVIEDANYNQYTFTHSALAGDVAIIWGTGLTRVQGNEAAGPLPANQADVPAEVHIGLTQATITYRGRSGCCAGVDQIVFTVPPGITGCQVPVSVQIGDIVSNLPTMPIAADSSRVCSGPEGPTSISPSLVSLGPSQTQQFTASGLGTNPAWSISPSIGSITTAGLYTAPSSVTAETTVTVTAMSITDSTEPAWATVTLNPAVGQTLPPPTTIAVPLEVLGSAGTTASVSFNIPSGTNLSGLNLWMQIHGLLSQTQASLQMNGGPWQPISEGTVTLLGLANAYGGIGGGFHTLQMTMPAAGLTIGTNTLTFRFNGTDGRVSGFRVLAFNVQDEYGNSLIPSSQFVNVDPNTWQPPSTNPSDISAGEALYRSASLTVPTASGPAPIQAHCMDCHAQDGRDLKYFNYSNLSIQTRSIFHGLSPQQGNQIASYIRSLNVPNPGRPWNPPYQPGPGLDSQPVSNWSAGAGLGAVLPSDRAMLSNMFPNGTANNPGFFSIAGDLNAREQQIALMLPDWNAWLPGTHPMDAWADFASSGFATTYPQIRAALIPDSTTAYAAAAPLFGSWNAFQQQFMIAKEGVPAATFTPAYNQQVYSTMQWAMVKSWELNQEFGLEGMATTIFTKPGADTRAWNSGFPFFTSPNMLHIPAIAPTGIGNGSLATRNYLAFVWYQTQLILNSAEKAQSGTYPIDWGYAYGFVDGLRNVNQTPQGALFTFWLMKGLQIDNSGYATPVAATTPGWSWIDSDISRAVSPGWRTLLLYLLDSDVSGSDRTAIMTGLVTAWLAEVNLFTPAQYWATGDANFAATRAPIRGEPDSPYFEDRVWYMIPQFRYYGVPQALVDQMAAWAQTIWTSPNWTPTTSAICIEDGSGQFARCSTEQ
jgi:uncharacterized protein (TIGR03437 family)